MPAFAGMTLIRASLVMNLIQDILKPYIGICKHLPVYSTICRYIFGFHFLPGKLLDDPAVQAQSADCVPGEFPQPLSRPPDTARALDCRAQFALFPVDPNADQVVVVAARFARATCPRDVLNDQFRGLDASSGRAVVSIADADQPLAITREADSRAQGAGPTNSCLIIRPDSGTPI